MPRNPIALLTLEDGTKMTCRIIDLSLSGAAIAAEHRPPLKSLLLLGKVQSRVVETSRKVSPSSSSTRSSPRRSKKQSPRVNEKTYARSSRRPAAAIAARHANTIAGPIIVPGPG